jgi:hypothetical protein
VIEVAPVGVDTLAGGRHVGGSMEWLVVVHLVDQTCAHRISQNCISVIPSSLGVADIKYSSIKCVGLK